MSGPGHNRGPTMEPGASWRRHCWGKARRALLPQMPLEVVRYRMARAAEIGLDYSTYAGVRASTGRDIVAVLFSSNALRLLREARLAGDRAGKLAVLVACDRLASVHPPLAPEAVSLANPGLLDHAFRAPGLLDGWSATRGRLIEAIRTRSLPADGVLLVGETHLEREWVAAARLAGYVSADRYFPA